MELKVKSGVVVVTVGRRMSDNRYGNYNLELTIEVTPNDADELNKIVDSTFSVIAKKLKEWKANDAKDNGAYYGHLSGE